MNNTGICPNCGELIGTMVASVAAHKCNNPQPDKLMLGETIAKVAEKLSLMPGYAPGSANAALFAQNIRYEIWEIVDLALQRNKPTDVPEAYSKAREEMLDGWPDHSPKTTELPKGFEYGNHLTD